MSVTVTSAPRRASSIVKRPGPAPISRTRSPGRTNSASIRRCSSKLTRSRGDAADDALALLAHLGVERAFFVGMSQGGFLSLRAALRAPDRVRGLALIDSQAGPEPPEVIPLYEAMTDEWVAQGPSDDLAETIAGILLGPADPAP